MGRVVVGIDGSKGAQAALEFAVAEARMRGDVLEVVYVHAVPAIGSGVTTALTAEYASADVYAQMVGHDEQERQRIEDRARQFGERLLSDAVEKAGTDDLNIETTLLFDRRPARRLVSLVHDHDDVDLLVVGSRGRGELSGLLLGSTSQACVTHAGVPVTVVPHDELG